MFEAELKRKSELIDKVEAKLKECIALIEEDFDLFVKETEGREPSEPERIIATLATLKMTVALAMDEYKAEITSKVFVDDLMKNLKDKAEKEDAKF